MRLTVCRCTLEYALFEVLLRLYFDTWYKIAVSLITGFVFGGIGAAIGAIIGLPCGEPHHTSSDSQQPSAIVVKHFGYRFAGGENPWLAEISCAIPRGGGSW